MAQKQTYDEHSVQAQSCMTRQTSDYSQLSNDVWNEIFPITRSPEQNDYDDPQDLSSSKQDNSVEQSGTSNSKTRLLPEVPEMGNIYEPVRVDTCKPTVSYKRCLLFGSLLSLILLISIVITATLLNTSKALSSGECEVAPYNIPAPEYGSCLCVNSLYVNIRAAPCGSVIRETNTGDCYIYIGSKMTCAINGVSYNFFHVQYGSSSGWIVGNFLYIGAKSMCLNSTTITAVEHTTAYTTDRRTLLDDASVMSTIPTVKNCQCVDGTEVCVRDAPCGIIVGQTNTGDCYIYTLAERTCFLPELKRVVTYLRVQYGFTQGWIARNYLRKGETSDCKYD